MARRTPFPFADHVDRTGSILDADTVARYIAAYEEALLTEYKSGDVDVASYHEGLRTAYEQILVDLLGIEQEVMDAYWGRTEAPSPPTYELPYTGGNQLISYERVEAWTGRRLNAEQWEALDEAVGKSAAPLIRGLVDRIAE